MDHAVGGGPVNLALHHRVSAGELQADPQQVVLAERLDALYHRLAAQPDPRRSYGRLFSRRRPRPVRGLYVHGAVGRGKTMLMDIFCDSVTAVPKRRCHFHEFMADVHDRIHRWRQLNKSTDGTRAADPIPPVAADLAEDATLVCFDEFFVTDIADAMILARLFTELFAHGVILVATSNIAPADLYKNGLNRALFMPFIELLGEHTETVELLAKTDYRLETLAAAGTYFTPLNRESATGIDDTFTRLLAGHAAAPLTLEIKGHQFQIPAAGNGAAKFHFDELCDRPLGARDYQRLTQEFHTIFITDIPRLTADARNPARRFITLIDTLYNAGTKLVVSAAERPGSLLQGGALAAEFARTASRLVEMQSAEYLAASRTH